MNTQYLTLPEGRIAYDDQGSGRLVVCIPSLGDVRAEYRFLTPLLVEAGYRVVTLDMRGQGESSPNWPDYTVGAIGSDILALVKYLNAGPALVIGTSIGAGAAVCAAAEAPELIRGIVLVGPFVRVMAGKLKATFMRLIANALAAPLWGVAFWMKYYNTLYPTRKPADFADYLANLKKNLKEPGRLRGLRKLLSDTKEASDVRLARVRVPVLVVMGTKDPDFKDPAGEAQTIVSRLTATQPTVQMLENAGHYPHAEMPEQTLPAILSFFNSVKEKVTNGN